MDSENNTNTIPTSPIPIRSYGYRKGFFIGLLLLIPIIVVMFFSIILPRNQFSPENPPLPTPINDSKYPFGIPIPTITHSPTKMNELSEKFPHLIEDCRFAYGNCVKAMSDNEASAYPGGIIQIKTESIEKFISNHTSEMSYILNQGASIPDLAKDIDSTANVWSFSPKVALTILVLNNPPFQVLSEIKLTDYNNLEPSGWGRFIFNVHYEFYSGFYGWDYRKENKANFENSRVIFQDGSEIFPPEEAQAGDVALYRFFAKYYPKDHWEKLVSKTHPDGFYQTYFSLFDYPDEKY